MRKGKENKRHCANVMCKGKENKRQCERKEKQKALRKGKENKSQCAKERKTKGKSQRKEMKGKATRNGKESPWSFGDDDVSDGATPLQRHLSHWGGGKNATGQPHPHSETNNNKGYILLLLSQRILSPIIPIRNMCPLIV